MKQLVAVLFVGLGFSSLALAQQGATPDYFTPQTYGAQGNGIADDTVAVSQALNSGFPVKCRGTFKITSKITVNLSAPGQELNLQGAGKSACVIQESGQDAYIEVHLPNLNNFFSPKSNHVTLTHATIAPDTHVAHGAIEFYGLSSINGVASAGSADNTLFIDDLNVFPTNGNNYSDYDFYLKDMRGVYIKNSTIQGRYYYRTGGGIYITSGKGSAPVDFPFADNIVYWWDVGINFAPNTDGATTGANDWEGAYLSNNTIVAVNTGIKASTIDNSANLLTISGGHIYFRQYGIQATDIQNLNVSHVYFLAGTIGADSVPSVMYGIYDVMTKGASQYGHLADNSFDFTGATNVPTRYDIYATQTVGAIATTVHDNTSIWATKKFTTLPTSPAPKGNIGY